MWWWVLVAVAVAFTGLAVLAVFAAKVFLAVERLARQVAVSTDALTAAGERLKRAARPVAERAGEISRP